MGWYDEGSIHKTQEQLDAERKQTQPQNNELRKFYLKKGFDCEVIWIDDFKEANEQGHPIVPFGWIYEHVYQTMLLDQNSQYTIKNGYTKDTTCRRRHPDGKGCPFCTDESQASKSAYLTVLVKKTSKQSGKEYWAKQLFPVKAGNWDHIKEAISANGGNLQFVKTKIKRKSVDKSITSGEIFSTVEQLTRADLEKWEKEELLYGGLEPCDYIKHFEPMTFDEMNNDVATGKIQTVWKRKKSDTEEKPATHLTMEKEKEKEKEDKVPF